MKKTGAQLILEVLLEHGVDTVFGYPGGAALNVYDALYEYQDRIKHILTAHRTGARLMRRTAMPEQQAKRACFRNKRPRCNKSGNRDCNSLHGQRSHGCHYQQCDK
mgnify:CR=1 FL=1